MRYFTNVPEPCGNDMISGAAVTTYVWELDQVLAFYRWKFPDTGKTELEKVIYQLTKAHDCQVFEFKPTRYDKFTVIVIECYAPTVAAANSWKTELPEYMNVKERGQESEEKRTA